MSAVLLNLLNELGNEIKCEGFTTSFINSVMQEHSYAIYLH